MEKVVLAYSGGLDTTAIIPWLKETYGYEVVCCCIDCGQGEELDGLEERAKISGASKLYIEDIIDDFAENYIMPCVQAGAVYEHKYLMATAMARPVITAKLVEIARKENAVAICHGATGKGNDQIRFELGIKALAPDIKVIAPWRDDRWQMDSRQAEIDYCKAHGIDIEIKASQGTQHRQDHHRAAEQPDYAAAASLRGLQQRQRREHGSAHHSQHPFVQQLSHVPVTAFMLAISEKKSIMAPAPTSPMIMAKALPMPLISSCKRFPATSPERAAAAL